MSKNLADKRWRLNNLYWIRDDAGKRILFKLNWAQEYLLEHLHYLNIILKARQLGITTFFCITYLDDVLFAGKDAGLIAHTLQDATKIFDTKVRYAWDNLPDSIKECYKLDADSARELKFRLGKIESSIYVGTSLRSGTVQRLHISELGTIDQKYPAKSIEIKSGALNTVHRGQIVTIESTAKGEIGVFADFCRMAMDLQKSGKKLTEMDYRFFFFPWYMHPQYELGDALILPRGIQEYFDKIEIEEGATISKAQRCWYYKKKREQGEAMKTEFPSTPAEAFQASIEGAYYGKQMDKAMEQNRISSVPWIPDLPVDTYWDLGIAEKKTDAMSIVFTQEIGLEIHIIDFYGNSGEGLSHYIKHLQEKPYVYGRHYAPHDIEVKELSTGKTRLESARRLGISFDVVPRTRFNDGVDAVRMVLSKCWFDEEKTTELTRALKSYRKEWDDRLSKFKDRPLQDWSCDPADAFRMFALNHPEHKILGFYDADEREMERIKNKNTATTINPLNPFDFDN